MPRKSNKRYIITITEEVIEKELVGHDWKVGAGQEGEGGKDQHGYTPLNKVNQNVTREIYTQNVDKLDLKKVIEAVNK